MKRNTGCALLALALMGFVGCSSDVPQSVSAATPAVNKPSPAAEVQPAVEEFIASGPLVVENQLDVTAQREGIIASILVDTGTPVHKGQLLATLDDRQLTADRDAAKAHAEGIQADIKNWEAMIKMSEVDLDRSEKMFAANLVTREQLEHERYKVVANRFERDRELKNHQRSMDLARSLDLELEKTRITAPFDGVVARRYVRNGQRVASGDRLFWVSATSPLRVKFTVPAKYAYTIKRGSAFEVLPVDGPPESHLARAILVSPVIDPATGTMEVTAELTGPGGSLKPGMITNIRLGRQ